MILGCAFNDLGSKGQGHNALITENGLCCIIPRMCHIDFGQKVQGQGHNAFITKNGNWHIIPFPLHLSL